MGRAKARPDCQLADCDRPHHGFGYCAHHYNQYRLSVAPDCSDESCTSPARSRGMCHKHYSAWLVATSEKNVIDYDDFWEFVKKELKIGQRNVA
jgi:hypothetical protein